MRQSSLLSLLLLVCSPLTAVAGDAPNADTALAFAPPPAREFAPLPMEEKKRLRTKGQAEFYAGDYEKMAETYSRLLLAEDAAVDDGRWLGHAFQLRSQWKEAASVYTAVIDRMDQLLDRIADEDATGTLDPGWPSGNKNELQERAAIILLTARIQRYCLNDPAAAEKTLRRIYRGNDVFIELLEDIARAWRGRIARALLEEKDAQFAGLDIQKSLSLRFPMMALRELAAVQQLNGNYADAFQTWQRIHWTTRQYIGHGESLAATALHGLIQNLPAETTASAAALTLFSESSPTADFDLADPVTLSRAYDLQNHYWAFALAAPRGQEFQSLDFICDIEQLELRYGGQFECWTLAGPSQSRKSIGSMQWPNGKPPGREKLTAKYSIEPGAGLVHFRVGSWKDKFKVHGVKVTATLRPIAVEAGAAVQPVPGFIFHTDFLPEGGSITLNQKPYRSDSTTHNMPAGRYELQYAHPRLPEPRRYTLDFLPGGNYALFVNLDSPLTGGLTNLRGFEAPYGPTFNIVKMPDGRWLVAWCHGGLRFATSADGLTWSEPIETSDAALFNENYNTLAPTLFVDKQGTIWVAYFSNQLDIDQLNTGGYRLFLRSSKNGREWSAARPVKIPLGGWPPGNVQLLNGPNGKVWMLYRLKYAEGESPAALTEFKDLDVPVTEEERSHAMNPHATLDAAGQMHLVWDHFSLTLYYSRRNSEGAWSEPVEIPLKDENSRPSHPQLIVRGARLALIYDGNQSAFLRRGKFKDGEPIFGEPIKIASHTARVIGTTPLTTSEDRVTMLFGGNTVWTQSASVDALLNDTRLENAD
jgi:hypothetical protein